MPSRTAQGIVIALALLAATLAVPAAASAQGSTTTAAGRLRVEWQVETRNGRPMVTGFVQNNHGLSAGNVYLLVEQLDREGRVVGKTTTVIYGDIPSGSRESFEVRVPTAEATYRVGVLNVSWLDLQK